MREPRIYENLDIDEYHASEGISSTGISLILDCPKRYHYEYIEKPLLTTQDDAKKERDKYKLGQAVHMLVLEPAKFESTFYCMTEKVNLTTKAGKEIYAQAEMNANGREILRAGDWEDIKAMAESVLKHSIWATPNPKVEHSIFWDGGIYNTRLRARPDMFNEKLIIDLKTTDSIKSFSSSVYQYGYHRQAAMQIDALKQIDGKGRIFALFVVEKRAPFLTACFQLDEASIEQGRQEYLEGAATFSECVKYNSWPSYDEYQMISIPKWAMKREELENA